MKVIIVVFLLLLCSIGGASAWYDGFDYRIPITIDNTGNPALENYQFNVSFSEGINESSIRVVNENSYSTVPHWCENETDGLCYELWFNVSIGSEVNTDYYIYYGNNSISSTSDYDSTFTKKYNDSGLVLELHMDEGTGHSQTNDTSGEGNHGTLTNMNVTGNDTSGWHGIDGGQWDNRSDMTFADGDQLRFDGVNDYINCGTNINLTSAVTISMWINPTDLTVGNDFYVEKLSVLRMYQYGIGGRLRTNIHSGITSYATISDHGVLKEGKWQHVAFVWSKSLDSGYGHIYWNGVETAYHSRAPTTSDIDTNANDLLLMLVGSTYANSSLDEFRIYNRSLSGDEIYRQYIRSKYAVNDPGVTLGQVEGGHEFLIGATEFYEEMRDGLTGFKDEMGKYLVWGVLFFAVGLAFTIFAKIKTTLVGGK